MTNAAPLAGVNISKAKNAEKQLKLTVVLASEKSLNVVLKTPRVGFSHNMIDCENTYKNICEDHCYAVPLIHGDQYQNIAIAIQETFYKLGLEIPVYLPLGNTAAELVAYQDNLVDKISYVLTKAYAGETRFQRKNVIYFLLNNETYSMLFDL